MKKTKMDKGITLIALIITIVVLLILAVVAIRAVQDDGIIGHARNAANEYTLAQEIEELKLAALEYQLSSADGTVTLEGFFKTKYGEGNVQLNDDGTVTVTMESGNKYKVTSKGEVTLLDSAEAPTESQEISFTINGEQYKAKAGMTWSEWIGSTYDTSNNRFKLVYTDEMYIQYIDEMGNRGFIKNASEFSTIEDGKEYTYELSATITFYIGDVEYEAERGWTFEEWFEYKTGNPDYFDYFGTFGSYYYMHWGNLYVSVGAPNTVIQDGYTYGCTDDLMNWS